MAKYSKILGIIGAVVVIPTVLYTAKCRLGIDFDPAHHLRYYFSHPATLAPLAEAQIILPLEKSDLPDNKEGILQPARIVVDFSRDHGPVNYKILGLNVLGVHSPGEPGNPYSDF